MVPINALGQPITLLKGYFGRLDPEWGELNRIRRGRVDLAIDGGPDVTVRCMVRRNPTEH